jgi:hypothetical protein
MEEAHPVAAQIGLGDRESLAFEHCPQELPDVSLILDYED